MKRGKQNKDALASLREKVLAGQRLPFCLLYGEEPFERDETLKWLIERWTPSVAPEFNFDRFSSERLDLEAFLKAYQSYPMMAEHRLIVLRDCEKLNPEQCKKLEAICRDPSASSTLVAVGAKVDMRRSFFKQFNTLGAGVNFKKLYDNQVPQWIGQRAKHLGIGIDERAIALLRLYIGPNLRELAGEIDKLSIYVGEGETITGDAVQEGIGGARHNNIFTLTDAVGAGNRRKAHVLMRRLLTSGEEPLRILAMVSRHFQLILKAQDCLQMPKEDAARRLGVAPYFLADYLQQARRFSRPLLWRKMSALLWAETQLKSAGRRREPLVMDLLLHDLC
jgi:DNA polymerase III subunit delta